LITALTNLAHKINFFAVGNIVIILIEPIFEIYKKKLKLLKLQAIQDLRTPRRAALENGLQKKGKIDR
jgi:hypothetical protein